MNKERLEELARKIEQYPEYIHMDYFSQGGLILDDVLNRRNVCGSTGCIAGLTVIFFGCGSLSFDSVKELVKKHSENLLDVKLGAIAREAMEILELTPLKAKKLFYVGKWPKPLKAKLLDATNKIEYANVCAERIRFMCNTGK